MNNTKKTESIPRDKRLRNYFSLIMIIPAVLSIMACEFVIWAADHYFPDQFSISPLLGLGMLVPMGILVEIFTFFLSGHLFAKEEKINEAIKNVAAGDYSVKLDAAELLMENTANTFTTPVFNGSASLRDAAGQLIEETAKAVRRKKTVDDAFIDNLYSQVNSLYRLDQIGGQARSSQDAKANLGPLPGTAVALLCAIVAAWVLMGLYLLRQMAKKKKK